MFVLLLPAAFWLSSYVLVDATPLHCINVDNVNYQRRYFYGIIWMNLPPGKSNDDFWAIIDNKHLPKTEIKNQLIAYGNRAGGNLKISANGGPNVMNSQYQGFRSAITNSNWSPAAKNFALTQFDNFYNYDISWEETCKRNNQVVLQQSQETVDELQTYGMLFNFQLFVNSYCLSSSEAESYRQRFSDCPNKQVTPC